MALSDDNSMVMPVAPMYGNGNGFGGFGGDWSSWIILFLIFGMFGGNGWGGFGGGFGGGLGYDFPWLLNGQNGINANTNSGFDHLATQNMLSGIQSAVTSGFGDTALGIAGVNQNICQTGNGIINAVTGAQNSIAQQMYAGQIADLERSFAAQTANTQGMNALQAQLAQCCCDNRAATADLKYTVATEACADRAAVGDALQNVTMQNIGNTNAIVNAINGGIQSIKDQLCDYRDAQKDDTIANLRQELMYSRGQASQTAQTAQILSGQAAEIDGVYNRLKNCPVGTYTVCNPLTPPNYGCGCGCGSI